MGCLLMFVRDKHPFAPDGTTRHDGKFGYAVASALLHCAEGEHSLADARPTAAHQFNNWA